MNKYIEMCRVAYDLQREYEPEVEDRVWDLLQHKTKTINNLKEVYDEFGQTLTVIWLPSPDQILSSDADLILHYTKEDNHWSLRKGGKEYFKVSGDSLHEVALAYYMKVKYNKHWDGDKWVMSPRSK